MNSRVKIVLLGLMVWAITFMAGFIVFVVFGAEAGGPLVETEWINGIRALFLAIGLALGLFLLYRGNRQGYKRVGWEAGIAWYVIILLMNLITLVGFIGLELALWFPLILIDSTVLIIPVVVGHLLAGSKEKA